MDGYLEHYGVKGMKWGVRKDRSSGSKPSSNKDAEGLLGKMSPQSAVLIAYGATIVSSILARSGLLYLDSGRNHQKRNKNISFKKNPSLSKKMSVPELEKNVVKHINPGYGENGTKMNCRRTTMAYEMRRRGYDVKATRSDLASGQTLKGFKKMNQISGEEHFESIYGQKLIGKGSEYNKAPSSNRSNMIFDSIKKEPNGSRGEVGFAWTMGGGHSMAYEVVNGKPVIFDAQNGKTYASPESLSSFAETTGVAAITRLDNRKIDEDLIKRWVENV